MTGAPLLQTENLGVAYDGAIAVDDVSFDLAAGEIVALLGANGAGKTSTLAAIMGLVVGQAGTVRLAGDDVTELPSHDRASRGLAYVPEGRRVFPGMSVADNLLAACLAGAAVRRQRLDEMLALFPALAERREAPAWQLSGGEQQMLALARGLIAGPKVILMDEPSLGLAPKVVADLFGRLSAIAARGVAVLLAEQNVDRALDVAGRVIVLDAGRIGWEGSVSAAKDNPIIEKLLLGG